MKKAFLAVFRMNPAAFAFMSGIVISLPMDLISGIALEGKRFSEVVNLLFASAVLTIGALLWSVLAWRLESILRVALLEAPSFVEADKAWEAVVSSRMLMLVRLLVGSLALTIIGLLFMFL